MTDTKDELDKFMIDVYNHRGSDLSELSIGELAGFAVVTHDLVVTIAEELERRGMIGVMP